MMGGGGGNGEGGGGIMGGLKSKPIACAIAGSGANCSRRSLHIAAQGAYIVRGVTRTHSATVRVCVVVWAPLSCSCGRPALRLLAGLVVVLVPVQYANPSAHHTQPLEL